MLGSETKDTERQKDPDRRQRLEALPGWSWEPYSDQREDSFSHLKEFSEQEGHCRVSQLYKADDGFRLGQWVINQRSNKDTMELVRRQRLEALPGWSWEVLSDQWEQGFSHLKMFSEREGHCRVVAKYKTEDGYGLGRWVNKQRTNKDRMDPAAATLGDTAGLVVGSLVGPVGRRFLPSRNVLRARGSLPGGSEL